MGRATQRPRPSVDVIARLGRQIASRGRTRFGDTAANLILAGDGLVYQLTKAMPLPVKRAARADHPKVNVRRWTVWGEADRADSKQSISGVPIAGVRRRVASRNREGAAK